MVVLVNDRAYEVEDEFARRLAETMADLSKGVGAVERDGTMVMVNEPPEAAEGYEADGWRVYARR